jgi:hypothetical protein
MPDGSRAPEVDKRPRSAVEAAVMVFGVLSSHPWVEASVHWIMYLRGDRNADPAKIASHYALWCFDVDYYKRVNRLFVILGMRD